MIRELACRWYQRKLSAFRDGELQEARAVRVQRHVQRCPCCRQRLEELDLLSESMAECQRAAAPTERLWQRIEAGLDRAASSQVSGGPVESEPALSRRPLWRGWRVPSLAAAVTVVIVALIGISLRAGFFQMQEPPLSRSVEPPSRLPGRLPLTLVPIALDVGSFVADVSSSSTPERFWNAYRATSVSADELLIDLDFRPVVPEELPGGYRLVESKLLRDACCTTLEARYQSPGGWLDVFQFHDTHPIEFGEVDVERREIQGVICTAFKWGGSNVIGRSFSKDGLNLVVVGRADPAVMDELVAELGS